ncbi:MAG: hypothetical protein O7A04_07615 [Acidobacteria bacterium]|nr:hypothetical protein [Acidobacteriota bacterium]
MDGTNVAQIAALDLSADLFLSGDTFEHEGLAGSKWTLRPTDTKSYKKALGALALASPGGSMFARQAMRSGLVAKALEAADDGLEKMSSILTGGNGDRSDQGMKMVLAQWNAQRDAALKEADLALAEVDVGRMMADQEAALIEAVGRHLVVKVANFPVNAHFCSQGHEWHTPASVCPECGAEGELKASRISGGPELALAIFATPRTGESILEDVLGACDRHTEEATKALEEHSGN